MSRGGGEGLRLLYHDQVVKKDIPGLDRSIAARIRKAIEAKLASSPEQFGKPLAYTRAGLWVLRVGDWRVVFALRQEEVWILRTGHRSEVYESLEALIDLTGELD